MVKTGASVAIQFLVSSETGALSNADALPTATLVKNGTATADVVTVSNISTGVYSASVTMPSLAAGDVMQIRVAATVGGVTTGGLIWRDDADTSLVSDIATGQLRILDRIDYQRGHHTAVGSTFYVDGVGGNDTTGNGSRATPYKTISKALTVCTSNKHDEIILLPNVSGGPTTITETAAISITKNYVQIRGPGRDVNVTRSNNGDIFDIQANGVELSGFRVTTFGGATSNGVVVSNASDFVRLHRLWIESAHQDAVYFNVANRCEVANCVIVAAGRDGIRVSSGAGAGTYNLVLDTVIRDSVGSAINLQGSDASDCRIQRNVIRDNAVGITVASGVLDTVITDNRFINNTTQIADSGARTLQAWNFLTTDTSGSIGNVTVGAINNNVITAASIDPGADTEIAQAVRTELATELARIDVAISSRLATAGYTAPPTAAANATELLTQANGIETGLTVREGLRLSLAALAGKLSGGGTNTIVIRNPGDTKDRITATVDGNNNRLVVVYDLT